MKSSDPWRQDSIKEQSQYWPWDNKPFFLLYKQAALYILLLSQRSKVKECCDTPTLAVHYTAVESAEKSSGCWWWHTYFLHSSLLTPKLLWRKYSWVGSSYQLVPAKAFLLLLLFSPSSINKWFNHKDLVMTTPMLFIASAKVRTRKQWLCRRILSGPLRLEQCRKQERKEEKSVLG